LSIIVKNNFKDKVAIITGSSRGIGKAIAISLAQQGSKVVINGRNSERLNKTLLEIKEITSEVLADCSDVSSISGSQDLTNKMIKKIGKIDMLINNVGISLESRTYKKAQRKENVAKTVLKNISKRKFISIQTSLGRLNALLHARQPLLVEHLLIKNTSKLNNFTI
jgi:NADP-dependent 3-hydroxy acid dehydrogenase YdfG